MNTKKETVHKLKETTNSKIRLITDNIKTFSTIISTITFILTFISITSMWFYNFGFLGFFRIPMEYYSLSLSLFDFILKIISYLAYLLLFFGFIVLFFRKFYQLYEKGFKLSAYILYLTPTCILTIGATSQASTFNLSIFILMLFYAFLTQVIVEAYGAIYELLILTTLNKEIQIPSFWNRFILPKLKTSKFKKKTKFFDFDDILLKTLNNNFKRFIFSLIIILLGFYGLCYLIGKTSAEHKKEFVIVNDENAAIYINQHQSIIIPCKIDTENNNLYLLNSYSWVDLTEKKQISKKFNDVILCTENSTDNYCTLR
ncbi:MAG: hypothetical protein K2G70_01505 [Turicibacter sp.]|nr:hypothetical protein [Turicibacter sp.]